MFVPLSASIVVVRFVTHDNLRSFGLTRGRMRYYLWAVLYPLIVVGIGVIFVAILGTAEIDFRNLRDFLPEALQEPPAVILAINLLLAPIINFVPAFGEEYGWRGFLLTKLTKRFGSGGGVVFTGLISGLWHAPFILNGYNYPNHPDIVGVTTFTVWCILAGTFLGWLALKSRSVFPAALGHGAINAYVGFGLIIAPNPDEMMTLPLGIPAILALLVLAIPFLYDILKVHA